MIYPRWIHKAFFILLGTALASSAVAAGNHGNSGASTPKAGAIKISESIVINADPATVWSTVRDFDAISIWHPAIESSRITSGHNNKPGAKRRLVLKAGGHSDEQLIAWDGTKMRYTYRMLKGDLPVSNYRSMIAVKAQGRQKATLIWEGEFDAKGQHTPAEARRAIRRIYRPGLTNVKALLGASH